MANMSPEAVKYMQEHARDDKRANLYACIACCIFLPSVAVMLRFLSRRKTRAPLKADDYLILSALVSPFRMNQKRSIAKIIQGMAIGMAIDLIVSTYSGLGRHIIFARNPVLFAKVYLNQFFSFRYSLT